MGASSGTLDALEADFGLCLPDAFRSRLLRNPDGNPRPEEAFWYDCRDEPTGRRSASFRMVPVEDPAGGEWSIRRLTLGLCGDSPGMVVFALENTQFYLALRYHGAGGPAVVLHDWGTVLVVAPDYETFEAGLFDPHDLFPHDVPRDVAAALARGGLPNGTGTPSVEWSDGRPAGEADIAAAERSLGVALPLDYRAVVSAHDGGHPEGDVHVVFEAVGESLRGAGLFLRPVVAEENGNTSLAEANRKPPHHRRLDAMVSFAVDGGGNEFAFDYGRGWPPAVVFLDHSMGERIVVPVADGFTAMLGCLRVDEP